MLARQERLRAWFVGIAPRSDRTLAKAASSPSVQDSDRYVAHGHREVFDRELLQVREGVVRMGELVAVAIDRAVDAMARRLNALAWPRPQARALGPARRPWVSPRQAR